MPASAEQPLSKPEDPLTTARRDFDAIKSGKTPSPPADSLRLQGSVPLVNTTEDAPVPLSPIQRARKLQALKEQSRTAANRYWLLDAMGVQTPAAEANAAQALASDTRSKVDPAADASTALTQQPRALHSNYSHSRETSHDISASVANGAPNPLQQYMADWLSSRDFQLLRSKVPSSATKNELASGSLGLPGSLVKNFAPLVDEAAFSLPTPTRSAMATSMVLNPYLSALPANVFVSPTPSEVRLSVAKPVQPSPTSAPGIAVPETTPTLPLNPTEAEKFKRAEDGKYFRQLKRF
jgi:hypothetical protein